MAKDDHQHDTNGSRTQSTILVGHERWTYENVRCSCGRSMENNLIEREDMRPGK